MTQHHQLAENLAAQAASAAFEACERRGKLSEDAIQTAILPFLSGLATKAATADNINAAYVEQLEKAQRLEGLLDDAYSILQDAALAESGEPEQDAYEREVLERVKLELGKA